MHHVPNDNVGLNALMPPVKPVVCGHNGVPVSWLDRRILLVGCPLSELKSVLEEVEPVDMVTVRLLGVKVSILGELKEVISGKACTNIMHSHFLLFNLFFCTPPCHVPWAPRHRTMCKP